MRSPFFTKAESAERLRCSPRTVERLIKSNKLRSAGVKGARVLIAIEEQIRFEEELRQLGRQRGLNFLTSSESADDERPGEP